MSAAGGRPGGGPLDWTAVRRRMEAAELAAADERRLSPERVRAVLDERARALARPAVGAAPVDAGIEVVVFTLSGEWYAVESRYVVEAFRMSDMAPLPQAAPPLVGVTAWRGELLVVLDLRDASAAPPPRAERVLVMGEDRPAFGIVIEEIREVRRIATAEIFPPASASNVRERLLGMTAEAVLVLDAAELIRTHT
ncbi:MAG: chemotaxis protein CheW [Gemmatimonadetes bacterium]|nr:chemotaxis protein CheW [Gemmatimonadota bacterium]